MGTYEIRDPKQAFADALQDGTLSTDESDPHYIGSFMYMLTKDGTDQFKHISTRRYAHDRATAIQAATAP